MTYAILNKGVIISSGEAENLWPDCSFPTGGPNEAFLTQAKAVKIQTTLPYNSETEYLVSCPLYVLNGKVYNVKVEPLPPPPVTPRWVEFGASLTTNTAVNTLVGTLVQAAPVLHLMLGVGLGQAAQGDPKTFQAAWTAAKTAGFINTSLSSSLTTLAASFDLPEDFINNL